MSDATATIRPREAAHFGAQAGEWWDPRGSSAMLHRLNPVRLAFLRAAIDRHWGLDRTSRHPLAGKRALDVGCGAGLLTEPLARLGADVTGVDAAAENIAVARAHAEAMGFNSPSPSGEGVGGRGPSDARVSTHSPHPHPHPSPEGEGLMESTSPSPLPGGEGPGVDAAAESIGVARGHAEAMGFFAPSSVRPEPVEGPPSSSSAAPKEKSGASTSSARTGFGSLTYFAGELAALALGRFDLVTSMEVLEHVADKPGFMAQLAAHLAPGGLLVLSTPNRTLASRALLVGAAEALGMVPRGTHDWRDFVTPDELTALLAGAGLEPVEMRGIAFSPLKGLHLSSDMSLDIILAARRAA